MPGQANTAAATVILPGSQFIDNSHINNPCTRVQFAAVFNCELRTSPTADPRYEGILQPQAFLTVEN